MEPKITYMLGAGASYNSCPIWKEQGEKMMDLPESSGYLEDFGNGNTGIKYHKDYPASELVRSIGEVGKKANEFNTVDTYAKKLFLLGKNTELVELKQAVSMFFTLWSLTNDTQWKQLPNSNGEYIEGIRSREIDPRYINLLATYLERDSSNPKLRSNIKFISWNYDLQLESAYGKFSNLNDNDYVKIDRYFPFIPTDPLDRDLVVCHLNGFHGFYGKGDGENLFNRCNSRDLFSVLTELQLVVGPHQGLLNFNNYINYAWEIDSPLVQNARSRAVKTMSETHILVIIGYSFPPFNYTIDKELLDAAVNVRRVIFQDPNAHIDILAENFGIPRQKITIINGSMDQFVIPNYKDLDISPYTGRMITF